MAPFHPPVQNPTLALQRDLDLLCHMDRLGYDEAWIGEHHSAAPELIAFWLKDGRVLAGMNVNVWDVTDPIQALIRSRAIVDPERLADPDVPLEAVAQAASSGRNSSA